MSFLMKVEGSCDVILRVIKAMSTTCLLKIYYIEYICSESLSQYVNNIYVKSLCGNLTGT